MIEAFGDQIWSADEIMVMLIITPDGEVHLQAGPEVEAWEVASYLRQVADDFERDGWDEYGRDASTHDDG